MEEIDLTDNVNSRVKELEEKVKKIEDLLRRSYEILFDNGFKNMTLMKEIKEVIKAR